MKKVLFLLSMFIAVGSVMRAQTNSYNGIVVTENCKFINSFSYSIDTLLPYNDGAIYYSTGASYDAIGTFSNGEDFTTIETLQANSVSKLVAWPGDSKAYYYGDANNNYGTELRVYNGSSANMLRNAGHGVMPAVTNVERMVYQNGNIAYYYMVQGEFSPINGGYEALVYQTDGTHSGTSAVSVEGDTLARHTNSSLAGNFRGFKNENSFNFVAAIPGGIGNTSSVFKVTYSDRGSTARYHFDNGSASSTMNELFTFDDYYLLTEEADLGVISYVNFSNPKLITPIDGYKFHSVTPVRYQDKVFAIGVSVNNPDPTNFCKLILIEDKKARLISLNNEHINDNIDNIVLSNNKLYFTATNSNGDNGVYAIDADSSNPQVIEVQNVKQQEVTALCATDDGIAFAIYNESTNNGLVYLSNGTSSANYLLNRGIEFGNSIFSYVSHLVANSGYLYIIEDNENGGSDLSTHSLSKENFKTGSIKITVSDYNTNDVIEGAKLTIKNEYTSFKAESNADGVCSFSNIPTGVYSYEVSAASYITRTVLPEEDLFPIYINPVDDNIKNISLHSDGTVASFSFIIRDQDKWDPIMGGGELEGAKVELTSGEYKYEAISEGNENPNSAGFANFSNVNYGQYQYKISCPGYASYTGVFNVTDEAETQGGPIVALTPTVTVSFLATSSSWSSDDYPYIPGVHVYLQSIVDKNQVFYVITNGSYDEDPKVMMYDVPYGEYSYFYSLYNHITQTGTISIDGNTDVIIDLEFASGDFIFNVTGDNTILEKATINLYEAGSTDPKYTGITDQDGLFVFEDLLFGTMRYEVIADGYTTSKGTLLWDENFEDYPNSSLSINLNSPGKIVAKVSDSDSPLAGALVTITNTEDNSVTFTGTTDMETGIYEFADVPYGVYDYVVSAEGYFSASGNCKLEAPGLSKIEVILEPEQKNFFAMVYKEGAMIDAGINGATVTLTNKADANITFTGITEGEGMDKGGYLFENIPYGDYSYEVIADDYVAVTGDHTVGDAEGGIIAFMRYAYSDISVSVMNIDLEGISEASISLRLTSDETIEYTAETDVNGEATLLNIPFGEYNYTIAREDYLNSTGTYEVSENSIDGIEVTLENAILTLNITVENRGKAPVEDAIVTIISEKNEEFTGTTDMDGLVVISDLEFGDYTYTVSAEDYEPLEGEYTIDADTNIEFTITIDYRTGIDEVESNVSVYPNPVSDIINIASDNPIETVGIYTINGQKIKEINTGNLNQIRVSDLSAGIYLVKVYDINGNIILRKVNKL